MRSITLSLTNSLTNLLTLPSGCQVIAIRKPVYTVLTDYSNPALPALPALLSPTPLLPPPPETSSYRSTCSLLYEVNKSYLTQAFATNYQRTTTSVENARRQECRIEGMDEWKAGSRRARKEEGRREEGRKVRQKG